MRSQRIPPPIGSTENQIYDALPNKDKTVKLLLNSEIKINGNAIPFEPTSESSVAVLCAIFPTETKINAIILRQALGEMIIRLETLEQFGDTEVIAIQTITSETLSLDRTENGDIYMVTSWDDIANLQE